MLTAVASLAFWVGGLVRVRPALADPNKRPLCLALLSLGAGAVFDTPVYSAFDRWAGVTNLSNLMAHGLGLVGVYFLLRTLDGLAMPSRPDGSAGPQGRWLEPALVGSLVASGLLFAATPQPEETAAFTARYGDLPTVGVYWMISIAFPTLCLVQLLRTAMAHWSSPVVELRWGLRVVAAGTVLGFFYAALKLAEVSCQLAGGFDLAQLARPVDLAALGLGLSLIAIGLSLTSPALGGPVVAWVGRMHSRLLTWRLDWLWTTLCLRVGAADVLVLPRGTATDPDLRLLRRVVEIRDAQATLWSYLSPGDVLAVQVHLPRHPREPAAELVVAGALALAVERELTGRVDQRRSSGNAPAPPVASLGRTAPLNPRQEARELIVAGKLIKKALRDFTR